MANPNAQTFKIVIVGDARVGKSNFVKRLVTNTFEEKYLPTMGVNVVPLTLLTNKGDVTLNFWDCAGQELYQGLGDGYYIGARGYLVFYDVTNPQSFLHVNDWISKINHSHPEAPIVLCGNKIDLHEHKVAPLPHEVDTYPHQGRVFAYDISARNPINVGAPVVILLRELLGQDTIITHAFQGMDDDNALMQQYEQILAQANEDLENN